MTGRAEPRIVDGWSGTGGLALDTAQTVDGDAGIDEMRLGNRDVPDAMDDVLSPSRDGSLPVGDTIGFAANSEGEKAGEADLPGGDAVDGALLRDAEEERESIGGELDAGDGSLHGEGTGDAVEASLVPASPVVPLDDIDDDNDDDDDDDDDVEDEDQERNPRKRRRQTEVARFAPPAEDSAFSLQAASESGTAVPSVGAAQAPATAAASNMVAATPSTSAEAKIRVYLRGCGTRIDVRASLTLQQVVRWEQTKRRKEADAKQVAYRPNEVAAAWVHHVPMPLSRTFSEVTDGLAALKGEWEVTVEPVPIASPWGIEVCRRTLLLALTMAVANVRKAMPHVGVLAVRAVTAHGLYLSHSARQASPLREPELRKLGVELRQALLDIIGTETRTRSRALVGPEAQASFTRSGFVLSEHMVRCTSMPAVVCDGVGEHLLLGHGTYTAFPLPVLSDLRGARLSVVPIATSSGLFVHFAPPSLQLLPFGEVEQRALLIAICEIDDQSRLLQATSAGKLNDVVEGGERSCKRHIEFAEAQLARRLSGFAERVVANRPRLLLISAPVCGGVEWLAHALELQLRLRELRGVCLNAAHWARGDADGGLRVSALRDDLATLFATGRVPLRELTRPGASTAAPSDVELPAGGYVLLYGERLEEFLAQPSADGTGGGSGTPGPLDDLPKPHFRVQALPLCSVSLDEHACVGGGAFLLLRHLAMAYANSGARGATDALRTWGRRRPVERERASEHIDLSAVGMAAANEWKPLNFAFAYELSIYAQLLTPALRAVPLGDSIHPEARRLLDLLAAFRAMPLEYVPSQSPVRTFCGGCWLPPRY